MSNLRQKLWFRIAAMLVINLFILAQSSYALGIDDKLIQQQTEEKDSVQTNDEQNVVVSAYDAINTPSSSSQTAVSEADFSTVVNALAECPAEVKASTLKAMGCSMGKAVSVLIGSGMSASQAKDSLVKAGYDKSKVSDFLGSVIEKTQETAKTETTTVVASAGGNIAEENTTVTASAATAVSSPVAEQPVENAAVETAATKNIETVDWTKTNTDYASLAAQGMDDDQIVSVLKQQGSSASDILKAASDLGKDTASVAKAMQGAGFTNKDIAGAFISKAMNWAKDITVDVINCAVQSLSEVLSGQGNIVTTLELAYEVIVSDVMQTGSVTIENGQVMSSMSAMQQTAKAHGVELQGVNGSVTDLENLSGQAIVHVDGNHWITVTDVKGDTVTAIDNGKEVTMTKSEFSARWDGNMLVDTSKNDSGSMQNMTVLNQQQMTSIKGASWGGGENSSGGDNGYGGGNDSSSSGGNEGNGGGSSWGGSENSTGGNNGYGGSGSQSSGSGGGNGSSWGGSENSTGGNNGYGGSGSKSSGSGSNSSSGGWSGVCESVSNAVSSVGSAIGSAIGAVGSAIGGAIGTVGGAISGAIGSGISSIGNAIGGSVGSAISGFGKSVSGIGQSIGNAVSSAIGAVGTGISSAIGAVGTGIGAIGKGIGAAVEAIGSGISAVAEAVEKGISKAVNSVTSAWGNMSTLGKVGAVLGTAVGLAVGMPGLGLVTSIAGDTVSGVMDGKSVGTAVAEAFDNSLAGKAVNNTLDAVTGMFAPETVTYGVTESKTMQEDLESLVNANNPSAYDTVTPVTVQNSQQGSGDFYRPPLINQPIM